MIARLLQHPVLSSVLAALLTGALTLAWRGWREGQDTRRILAFLAWSEAATDFDFRSTEAIASATDVPEGRVARLCARCPEIRRNEGKSQSWRLVERSPGP